jgi:multiple sugar transport system permease protein
VRYDLTNMGQSPARTSDYSRQQIRSLLFKILTYAVLVLWSVVCLFPLYWVAVTSLKGASAIIQGPKYLPFVDFAPKLDAWAVILTYSNDHLLLRFFNSAVVGVTSTLLTVLLGGLAVYGLTRFRYVVRWTRLALLFFAIVFAGIAIIVSAISAQSLFVGVAALFFLLATRLNHMGPTLRNDGILFAILATRILPPVVVALPIYIMALHTGTRDTHFALIFTYTATNLPVAVWLMLPVFGNIATSQEEAAHLDGASHFQIFFTVFLPMLTASIVAVGLVIFILCWNEYLFAIYLSTSPAAPNASAALDTGGSANATGESFLTGAIRSKQSRNATVSPAKACSTAFRPSPLYRVS